MQYPVPRSQEPGARRKNIGRGDAVTRGNAHGGEGAWERGGRANITTWRLSEGARSKAGQRTLKAVQSPMSKVKPKSRAFGTVLIPGGITVRSAWCVVRLKRRVVGPLSLLLLLLLLPLLSLSFGCSKPAGELRAGFESGAYRTIVAFGDSIVAGYKQPEGWPEVLGRDLAGRYGGVRVLNAGISGDTAGDGLGRLRRAVLAHQPDLVLIAFGLNDMKNGVSLSRFEEDLSAIVSEIVAGGAQPVLLTTTRLQRGAGMVARVNPAPYNESIRTLAEEKDIPLIDVNDQFKGLNTPEYLIDAAHLNGEGYRVLAEIIRKGLVGE